METSKTYITVGIYPALSPSLPSSQPPRYTLSRLHKTAPRPVKQGSMRLWDGRGITASKLSPPMVLYTRRWARTGCLVLLGQHDCRRRYQSQEDISYSRSLYPAPWRDRMTSR